MRKIVFTLLALTLFILPNLTFASTISVDFTADGQSESIAVENGDIIRVNWESQGSQPVLGCRGSGNSGVLTSNGQEWAGSSLPTSGTANLKIIDIDSVTASTFGVSCWLGDWPQNAQFGSNIGRGGILFFDKSIGSAPTGSVPAIVSLSPTSGPVGTKVQIFGSGFTNKSDIGFVGSTRAVSGSNSNTVSPINGELHFTNINSADGKTLTFTIPAKMAMQTSESGAVRQPTVVPGIYYVVVETTNGKSGVSYFKVTSDGDLSNFIPPVTSLVVNSNLSLGNLGLEVTKLQSILAKDSSIYPEGAVTGYFGSLTEKAVQRFQCKYDITCSGTPETTGYGRVGLNTRLKMEQVFGGVTATISDQNPADLQSRINDIMEQVRQLQTLIQASAR